MNSYSVVGKRVPRPDSLSKVTGTAKYTADICAGRRDILYAKALFPPYGHAIIKSIDKSEAEKLDGVEAVMTAADIPGSNRYGGMVHDKPVLAEKKVIYEGNAVAIVAARDLETAERAVSLIKVEYAPLEANDDPRKMLEDGAEMIHDDHPIAKENNISDTVSLVKGNMDEMFAKADIIIDNRYETPMLDHGYLEPDICLAEPDHIRGGITLYSPQHAVHLARKALCGVFGLPQSKIRVVSHVVGGGFGGKEDSTFDVSAIAGVLALRTGKPVVYEFTREEVFKNTGKRHAAFIHHKLAANNEGKLLGIDVHTILDKGAYKSIDAIPNRTAMYAGGAYEIPAAKALSHSVFTNHPYGCAFRGLGSPQAHFAIECQMDDLALELGIDPVELRLKNILKHGKRTIFNQVMLEERGIGLEECIIKVRDALNWNTPIDNSDPVRKKGRGIACYMYGTGTSSPIDGAHCIVQAQPDGSINVGLSMNELGQGLLVAMAQITAEAMGVSYEKVSIDYSDSSSSLEAGATVASRTTVLMGNAIIAGCNILRERLLGFAARHLKTGAENLDIACDMVVVKGYPEKTLPFEEVVKGAFASQIPLGAIGSWYPPMVYPSETNQHDKMHTYSFGAHGVEIEVDTQTGEIGILRSIQACDIGKAINPSTVEGQMEGGAAQGIGWAIMEEEFMKNGKMSNYSYHDYLIPTALDLPNLESIIVEHPNTLGPYGAKGVGEPPLVGAAPAIRNAFLAATGIKTYTIPLTPVRVMEALEKNGYLDRKT